MTLLVTRIIDPRGCRVFTLPTHFNTVDLSSVGRVRRNSANAVNPKQRELFGDLPDRILDSGAGNATITDRHCSVAERKPARSAEYRAN
jgi:hypothetical protein